MDLSFIERLLDLVERSDVAELDLTLDGARLRVVKAQGAVVSSLISPPAMPAEAQSRRPAAPQPPSRTHAVKAGFPGTFYRAPAPDAPPFVAVGDLVEDGKQLGIVEAMKTMNPVEADIAGIVRRIAIADAQPVESGDLLFEIEPHG